MSQPPCPVSHNHLFQTSDGTKGIRCSKCEHSEYCEEMALKTANELTSWFLLVVLGELTMFMTLHVLNCVASGDLSS